MKKFLTLSIIAFISIFLIGTTLVTAGDVVLTEDGKVPGKPFEYLQQQIDNIQLTPGPAGPQGPQGPAGADGAQGPPGECDCPITQEQLENLITRIEYLESLHPEIDPRFTDMGDGTIRDNDTGLIWLKDASCADLAGIDPLYLNGRVDWWVATAAAAALSDGTCGLTDESEAGQWRLATKGEWKVFMSNVYHNPALVNTVGDDQWSEGDAFTGVQVDREYEYFYWSSTEYIPHSASAAWSAYMLLGYVQTVGKVTAAYVWPVRSGN